MKPTGIVFLVLGLWSRPGLASNFSPWSLPDQAASEISIPASGPILLRGRGLGWRSMGHECTFWLKSGRSRLPLESVDDFVPLGSPGYSFIALRAKRPLNVARRYRLQFKCYGPAESLKNKNGVVVQVQAQSEADHSPPVWSSPPTLYSRDILCLECGTNAPPTVGLQFSTPIVDESQAWVRLTLWNADRAPLAYRLAVDEEQRADLIEYPRNLVPGMCYLAFLCAVDAEGNENCARPIEFRTASQCGDIELVEPGQGARDCSLLQVAEPGTGLAIRPVVGATDESLDWKTGAGLSLSGILLLMFLRLRRRRRGAESLGRLG